MWAEVSGMKAGEVTTEELARQMVKIEHEEAGERMSMEGMAGKLGYYECLGDYKLSDSLTRKLRSVTAKDVMRVMNKYFQPQKAAVVRLQARQVQADRPEGRGLGKHPRVVNPGGRRQARGRQKRRQPEPL